MIKNYIPFFFFFVATLGFSQNNYQKKIALIIGAQNYTSLPALRHSLSDARDMSASLKAKGFEVESLYDPKSKREIKEAINRYFNNMRDQNGAVGIIFYAGHGMQYEGENYIIPTTATLQNPGDLEDYCVRMNTVMAVLKSASRSLNILLLDACRSLPTFTRDSGEQGLSRMNAPQGSIIVFATQPGKTASDGVGRNGLFTSNLLKIINEPNLNITDVFKKVKQEVYTQSEERQLPSVEDNSIGGDFYFNPPIATPTTNRMPIKTSSSTPINTKSSTESTTVKPTPVVLLSDAEAAIGKQIWMTKNLDVDHFADGSVIPEAKNADEWEKAGKKHLPAWSYYENDPANSEKHGKLYNWFAVADPKKLCPSGWHVPSDKDWTALITQLGNDASLLKAATDWKDNGNGTNSSNFSGFPGGFRNDFGFFFYLGSNGYWWSATEPNPISAWSRSITYKNGAITRSFSNKALGYSVRCLKD
ncbi:MAG: caspase family protein [Bacteroidetes bacterium]|nr:caspase family protein [Bacteroidota bacterium]